MKKSWNSRTAQTETVGDAIKQLLNSYHLSEKFEEHRLIETWEHLMGKTIAKRTIRIFIKNKVLFIELNSAPLKNELNLSKNKILALIEREFGKDLIKELIIM